MGLFESLPQSFVGPGNHDQVHMIRHQAVTQQRKTVQFAILPQQLDISAAIRVIAQNHLPGIAALRNMMGNVSNDDTRQSSHAQKISERDEP